MSLPIKKVSSAKLVRLANEELEARGLPMLVRNQGIQPNWPVMLGDGTRSVAMFQLRGEHPYREDTTRYVDLTKHALAMLVVGLQLGHEDTSFLLSWQYDEPVAS